MTQANSSWRSFMIAVLAVATLTSGVGEAQSQGVPGGIVASQFSQNINPFDYNRSAPVLVRAVLTSTWGSVLINPVFNHYQSNAPGAPSKAYSGIDGGVYPGQTAYGNWIELYSNAEVAAIPRTCSGNSFFTSHILAFSYMPWQHAYVQIAQSTTLGCARHKCLGHPLTCLAPCTGCTGAGLLCQGQSGFGFNCCNCW